MSDLEGWVTETLNKLVKSSLSEQINEVKHILDGANQAERKALYKSIETRADLIRSKATALKGITGGTGMPSDEIAEQEQKAQHWERMLRIAKQYV